MRTRTNWALTFLLVTAVGCSGSDDSPGSGGGGNGGSAGNGGNAGGGDAQAGGAEAGLGGADAGADVSQDVEAQDGDSSIQPDHVGGDEGGEGDRAEASPDVVVDTRKDGDPGDPGTIDVLFDVHPSDNQRPISPWIYGVSPSFGVTVDVATAKPSLLRVGGNRFTPYNWENNATNYGSEGGTSRAFRNTAADPSNTPGAAMSSVLQAAATVHAGVLLNVPITDYVAGDKITDTPLASTGPVDAARLKQNKSTKGAAFTLTPDATDAVVYQDEFVNWAKVTAGTTPTLFSLGNQPELLNYDHGEVHPTKTTYAEVVSRNTEYAKAVKAVWPQAAVCGFVSYGWLGYTTLQDAPDATGRDFTDFYLDEMKAQEALSGTRLVDYLDLHYYSSADPTPDGSGRVAGQLTTPDVVKEREQSTRSLWDSSYKEHSWIVKDALAGGAIYLIPRMKAKIATHYAQTKLALSEWTFGGGGHISGAVASADALGIFGREGLDLAALFLTDGDESYNLAGLRAFRNFDGTGGQFGDTSVRVDAFDAAPIADFERASAYASILASDPNRIVIVAINKDTGERSAGIRLYSATKFHSATVYRITAATGAAPASADPLAIVDFNAFRYVMPGQSVSVIVPQP